MNDDDAKFFELRKEGKAYLTKVFTHGSIDVERRRLIRGVIEGTERVLIGEIEGAMCLRLTGEKRKTQVTALVSQDDGGIRRVTLETFQSRASGWYQGYEKDSFTFRPDEFEKLLAFLDSIKFIDRSNVERFDVRDVSVGYGPKIITDASDHALLAKIRKLDPQERERLLRGIHPDLTQKEINLLLGRRQGLEEFERQLAEGRWVEADWQDFFERQSWVFGYGLDYRIMRPFDREMVVGAGGTDNRDRPTVDYLMNFTDYSVLVEIKRPDTPIFQRRRVGRSGTWRFSNEFMDAVSQVLEQKAEWLVQAQTGQNYDKSGERRLDTRSRDPKAILVIGRRADVRGEGSARDAEVRRDTFELFRRDTRNLDIVTFDELLERARFITRD
ncbi:Shedu immune nuclease family protein [Rhizobium mulingense]|uniref:Shedu immune nuclease family protein n=1 Tax=Rhizobium mulingense TaxID=3031128 RepID=UPI002B4A9E3D|nr:Shedu immune nuclease family protein [Rhizobium sp. MJ21]MEB3042047.1 Shedu immune nuclease family protein [Rhizobium sp. MJ21]